MNEIRIFNNPQFGEIRTAGTADNPLFCLVDICRVLELRVDGVLPRLKQDGYNRIGVIDRLGREQQAIFVNEKNLYKVIMRSDKPQAEPFQDWVCGEVLPSIRRTGSYSIHEVSRKELALMIIQQEEEMEVLRLENKEKEEKIEKDAPKVVFADAIVGSRSSCLIGELAKILRQNGINMGQNRLFAWMRENHYLGTVGEYYNIPCQRYLEMGLFELKKNVYSRNGEMVTKVTPKVTGKGQQYFINLFTNLKKKVS
jgi:phage antirepressor YoqD-like protein